MVGLMGSEGRVGEVVSEGSVVSAGSAEGESQAVRRAAKVIIIAKSVFFIGYSSVVIRFRAVEWRIFVCPPIKTIPLMLITVNIKGGKSV
jgi:hypothetical protein